MSKTRVKIVIWLMLCGLAAGLALFLFSRLANVLTYFQEGADPASALNIVPNVPADLKVRLEWLPDDQDTGRQLEPFTRTQVESAYLRAWLQWNISYLKGEPFGLETYFVGPALEAVTEGVRAAHQQGWSLEQTDLEHQLRLHFYAADGSIVSFTAHDVLVAQLLRNEHGAPILAQTSQATYDVIMMLEDGNWRVRHWVRTEVAPFAQTAVLTSNQAFVTVSGAELMLAGRPYDVRGINYYPQATAWHDFWPNYDASIVAQDFKLIKSLGLNTVRIFIPYEPTLPEPESAGHGEPTGDEETVDVYEDLRHKLTDLLDEAESNDLKVIVTLFDFRTDYQILLWPNADRALEEVVPYFADHPAILAWDLKNEPDLDQPGNTQERVNTWLRHTAAQVRRHDANHLLTIGWARSDQAHQLVDLVDFVSFHDYEDPQHFSARYAALQTAVSAKPIVITEFGRSTWNSPFFPGGTSEQEQAHYYAAMLQAFETSQAAGFVAWTLYDFDKVPANVVGVLPWHAAPQAKFGLFNAKNEPKAAAFLLSPDANLSDIRPLGLRVYFKPFTLFVLLLGMGGTAVLYFIYRRYKKGRLL